MKFKIFLLFTLFCISNNFCINFGKLKNVKANTAERFLALKTNFVPTCKKVGKSSLVGAKKLLKSSPEILLGIHSLAIGLAFLSDPILKPIDPINYTIKERNWGLLKSTGLLITGATVLSKGLQRIVQ